MEMGFTMKEATRIFEDNETAIFLSDNPASTDRSKHIRLRWHYLRQCVRDGTLKLIKIGTKQNAADALTKAVGGTVMGMFYDTTRVGRMIDRVRGNV